MLRAMKLDLIQLRGMLVGSMLAIAAATVLLAVLGGAVMGVVTGAAIVLLIVVVQLLGRDAKTSWEGYRAMLPLSRAQIIGGHYLCLLVVALVMGAVALALVFATECAFETLGVGQAMGEGSALAEITEIVGGVTISALALPLAMLALLMPLVARLGYTKGFYAGIALFAAAYFVCLLTPVGPALADLLSTTGSAFGADSTAIGLGLRLMAVTLVLYAASAPLSCWLYGKRDL